MKLYLVRHGETDWNLAKKLQGRKGVGLNETGRKQVEALAEEIAKTGLKFDVCYVSPLQRAAETADILVGGKCEVIYDNRLLERSFGEFEGRSQEDFFGSIGENDIFDRRLNYDGFGLESVRDVLARAKSFLEEIVEKYDKESKVLVVAHGSLLRMMNFEIVGYDDTTDFLSFSLKNAELREYEIDGVESLRGER